MSDNHQQFVKASTNNSGIVSSNLEFIKTRMSKIDNITKRSADFCLERHTVDSANSGNQLFSKINDVRMANKPNRNKMTAAMMLRASSKIFCLLVAAKAIISAPPKSNRMERINCNQTYFLNKLFMWISSLNTIIVFAKGT